MSSKKRRNRKPEIHHDGKTFLINGEWAEMDTVLDIWDDGPNAANYSNSAFLKIADIVLLGDGEEDGWEHGWEDSK